MLLQSRASRISDALTLKDVDEIAESPPGAVQDAVMRKIREEISDITPDTKLSKDPIDMSSPVRTETADEKTKTKTKEPLV